MGSRHKTILAVSPDPQLARFRHDVLTREGFQVISACSEPAARYEIHFGRCGVLLLCHKLSRAARESLAHDFDKMCQEPYIIAFLSKVFSAVGDKQKLRPCASAYMLGSPKFIS